MDDRVYNASSAEDRLDSISTALQLRIVESIHFVITEFFLKIATSFAITISCRQEYTYNYFRTFVADLFRSIDSMAIQLILIKDGKPSFVAGPRFYNLYLVDSLQAFLDIDPIQYSSSYNTNEYYYIFLQQRDEVLPEETQAILDYCWRHHLINCNVQIQNARGQLLVYSYFPFRAGECGLAKTTLLTEFTSSDAMQNWVIFPKKLRNMNGCRLRVITWHIPPFMILTDSNRTLHGRIDIAGLEAQLLKQLSRQLNFSIEVVAPHRSDAIRPNSDDDTILGHRIDIAIEKLNRRTVELAIGYISESNKRNQLATSLFAHHQDQQVFAVLRGTQNYTSLEIFAFPYQWATWCSIVVTLLVGACVICIFQRENNAAWLDFIAIVMGVCTASAVPTTHQRLLNLNWSMGSFIIRSVYMALLYHLFYTNFHRKLPESVADLIRDNYTIIMNLDTLAAVRQIPNVHRMGLKAKIINSTNELASFEYLDHTAADGSKLMSAIGSKEVLHHYVHARNKPGRFHILPPLAVKQQLTIYLSKHSYLIDHLNECLLWIHSVGLMEVWLRTELDVRYFRSTHMDAQTFIGQAELNAIYGICGVLLVFAFSVFLLEIYTKFR